jgi:hypothetical protein
VRVGVSAAAWPRTALIRPRSRAVQLVQTSSSSLLVPLAPFVPHGVRDPVPVAVRFDETQAAQALPPASDNPRVAAAPGTALDGATGPNPRHRPHADNRRGVVPRERQRHRLSPRRGFVGRSRGRGAFFAITALP